MDFDNQTALLQAIYQGAVMGTEAIRQLLPKVDNSRFRSDLQTQNQQYQHTLSAADQQLKQLGKCPEELTECQQAMLRLGMTGHTICNKETSHLAELMIDGSNMGVIKLTKILNSWGQPQQNTDFNEQVPEPPASDPAVQLARDTIRMEEDNINRLKVYLQ